MDIAGLRGEAGLTQEEFWARVGITQSGGSRYETGARQLPESISLLLLLAYGSEAEKQSVLHVLRPQQAPRIQRLDAVHASRHAQNNTAAP